MGTISDEFSRALLDVTAHGGSRCSLDYHRAVFILLLGTQLNQKLNVYTAD